MILYSFLLSSHYSWNEPAPADVVYPTHASRSRFGAPLSLRAFVIASDGSEGLRSGMYLYICYAYSLIAVIVVLIHRSVVLLQSNVSALEAPVG